MQLAELGHYSFQTLPNILINKAVFVQIVSTKDVRGRMNAG